MQVRTMEYPLLAGSVPPRLEAEVPVDLLRRVHELEAARVEKEKEFARRIESVRQEALERSRAAVESDRTAWRERCATELTAAIAAFHTRTDDYLACVEQEVVRLALAIAERILHRESQLDPLLLSGAVRVALGQLAESTEVRLRVPADQREMWTEIVRLMPNLPLRPEVCADAHMEPGAAVLETSLGAVDLGVRSQLEEIERGFFDLLDVRRETSGGAAPRGPGGR